MKKFFGILVALTTTISALFVQPTFADSNSIGVKVNKQDVVFNDQTGYPIMQNGRVLLPFRKLFESLGIDDNNIEWFPEAQQVVGKKNDSTIMIDVGNNIAYVNGNPYTLDVPAQIINNRLYVPLRFTGEASGENVNWDASSNTVSVEVDNQVKAFANRNALDFAFEHSSNIYTTLISLVDILGVDHNNVNYDGTTATIKYSDKTVTINQSGVFVDGQQVSSSGFYISDIVGRPLFPIKDVVSALGGTYSDQRQITDSLSNVQISTSLPKMEQTQPQQPTSN